MPNQHARIKKEILAALRHQEASDGLYFRNFQHLHEADERDPVIGDELEVLEVLRELIEAKEVKVDDSGKEPIFFLNK